MFKLVLDPGHGGNDPGAVGNGLREKDLNLKIAKFCSDHINQNFENVQVLMTRSTDKTLSLRERTNYANNQKADYYCSIHINAGGGNGFESYIYSGAFSSKPRTDALRNVLHNKIISRLNFRDRGKKQANFFVLRETSMPAVLTENLFIDNSSNANYLKSDSNLKAIGISHAEGLASAHGWKRKEATIYYRVVTGSFLIRKNALSQQALLKKAGFESFLSTYKQSSKTYYRVISGSFRNKKNAEERVEQLKKKGFNSFITTFKQ
ncbi:N-acetylmuramoyl-L-alanine amidase [Bacillus carboniphilus]|uniref:N-acetylmuramoyl-L-alanine amidase n=1 Tax=Bacillus carboniphilus TaxID=86663 RepID=A0ABY9JUD6_9BACI|nr:N-acetylmuramoyl-L-alanine amidase [Bacillus carboniphilus]WLR43027.1 N-acetylmuramoyl-L-alanine amidase [Bacillus carboniphilus]